MALVLTEEIYDKRDFNFGKSALIRSNKGRRVSTSLSTGEL